MSYLRVAYRFVKEKVLRIDSKTNLADLNTKSLINYKHRPHALFILNRKVDITRVSCGSNKLGIDAGCGSDISLCLRECCVLSQPLTFLFHFYITSLSSALFLSYTEYVNSRILKVLIEEKQFF